MTKPTCTLYGGLCMPAVLKGQGSRSPIIGPVNSHKKKNKKKNIRLFVKHIFGRFKHL